MINACKIAANILSFGFQEPNGTQANLSGCSYMRLSTTLSIGQPCPSQGRDVTAGYGSGSLHIGQTSGAGWSYRGCVPLSAAAAGHDKTGPKEPGPVRRCQFKRNTCCSLKKKAKMTSDQDNVRIESFIFATFSSYCRHSPNDVITGGHLKSGKK